MLDKLYQLAPALEAFLFVYSAKDGTPGRTEGTHGVHSTLTEKQNHLYYHVCAADSMVLTWRSEGNLQDWVLFFHHLCSGHRKRFLRLGGNRL